MKSSLNQILYEESASIAALTNKQRYLQIFYAAMIKSAVHSVAYDVLS